MLKRRLVILGLSLGLILGAFVVAPVARAAGDGFVYVFAEFNTGGNWRLYDYAQNDADIQSEPSTSIMGPLLDGSYKNDFDSVHTTSGISSVQLFGNQQPQLTRLCFYRGVNYTGGLILWIQAPPDGQQLATTKNFSGEINNEAGSMRWALNGAACPA